MSYIPTTTLGCESQDYLFVSYRTGIGMAIIREGELVDGAFGNTGYLGHTTLDPDGPLCSCGNRGCLETYASKPTIERLYAAKTGNFTPFTELLHQPEAVDLLSRAGQYFGIALANAVKLSDIYTIVIDNLPISENHPFLTAIRSTAQAYCQSYAVEPLQIIPVSLPEMTGAHGAAFLF